MIDLIDELALIAWNSEPKNATTIAKAIALLKEQEETIDDLTDTIRQLNQHIKDLSEYMTPYGKVKDVKAYAELLKGQEAVKPIKKDTVEITARYEFDCPCGAPLLIGQPYCADCGKSVKWNDRHS